MASVRTVFATTSTAARCGTNTVCTGSRPGVRRVNVLQRRPQTPAVRTWAGDDNNAEPAPQASAPRQPDAAPAQRDEASSSSSGLLAAAAVGFGAALFVASRALVGGPSFAAMEESAVPLDTALNNGKPTIIEFYASWCEVCRELLPNTYDIEKQYQGQVNFVMLNVDNTRWRPEVLEYGVAGIPHFVFVDGQGNAQAAAVGRLPREVLETGAEALANGRRVPFARVLNETSPLNRPDGMAGPGKQSLPRDHS